MLPVADGEAVSLVVGEWVEEPIDGCRGCAFDPSLSFPIDLASSPTDAGEFVASMARGLRDAEGWLTHRPARIELPKD